LIRWRVEKAMRLNWLEHKVSARPRQIYWYRA
jgi:hypothetical protein